MLRCSYSTDTSIYTIQSSVHTHISRSYFSNFLEIEYVLTAKNSDLKRMNVLFKKRSRKNNKHYNRRYALKMSLTRH